MARQSKLTLQFSELRTVTIYGTRCDQVMRITKCIVLPYRGWVLMLGENGKVYSPQVHGIHLSSLDIMTGHKHAVLCGLAQLGVITESEAHDAIAQAEDYERKREQRSLAFSIRVDARNLGIKLPVAFERKLARF